MNKKLFFGLVAFVFLVLFPLKTKALDVGVTHIVYSTTQQNYVEVNLEIAASTITFKPLDSIRIQASAEVTIMLKQGEKVVNFDKYVLNSPVVNMSQSLLDVKRFFVPAGDYVLEVNVQDMNNDKNSDRYTAPIQVTAMSDKIALADVQLLRGFRPDKTEGPFTKNGFFLEPLPFNFYNQAATRLVFYTEVYQSIKSVGPEGYLVRYFIEKEKGNGVRETISMGNQKKKPSAIDAVLVQMDISKLESGNYSLTVELRNSSNELLAERRVVFQRSNPFLEIKPNEITQEMVDKQFVKDLDEKTLRFALRAVGVMAKGDNSEELKNILAGKDLEKMRFYLFRYFVDRDPNNPELAYQKYMETARAAHEKFNSGFRYGFESDRGRTYMRFGRPDDLIHVEDDPSAAPYEIWIYYNFPATKQQNVKFLFYNPTLAGDDFILLHSNARGEISNPRWEVDLYKRNAPTQIAGDDDFGGTTMQKNVNRNARWYFEDF